MDWQTFIVGAIIFTALIYAGFNLRRKIKSFSLKSACGSDCGCAVKEKPSKFNAATRTARR